MAEDAVALYGLAKKQLESMNQREAELQKATAALQAAVAELKGLPFTLGKQTSQYIGMGVREAIQQDFDTPIKESFQGPIANLERATRDARSVMMEVSSATRFHAFSWWGSVLGLGILLGALGYHFLEIRKFDDIQSQLNTIQQQIAPAAPAQDAKPMPGGSTKGRHGHSASLPTVP
jgi:hypothetical protein